MSVISFYSRILSLRQFYIFEIYVYCCVFWCMTRLGYKKISTFIRCLKSTNKPILSCKPNVILKKCRLFSVFLHKKWIDSRGTLTQNNVFVKNWPTLMFSREIKHASLTSNTWYIISNVSNVMF
jgi:hypothetical protein